LALVALSLAARVAPILRAPPSGAGRK